MVDEVYRRVGVKVDKLMDLLIVRMLLHLLSVRSWREVKSLSVRTSHVTAGHEVREGSGFQCSSISIFEDD